MPTTLRHARRTSTPDSPVLTPGVATVADHRVGGGRVIRFPRLARHVVDTPLGSVLTASGMKLGTELAAEQIKRLKQPWQVRALTYYDVVPEIHYAGQFYSQHMSKVELIVQVYDPAEDEWDAAPNSKASDFLARIEDPGGGRSVMLGTYGRLRMLTGESYLVCFAPDTPVERWEMLSSEEWKPKEDGKTFQRVKGEGIEPELWTLAPRDNALDDPEKAARTCLAWRLWRRHPRFSLQADSSMRAVMDVCEELLLLTLAVRAQARSRIARSGLLAVPSEISPPPPEPVPNEDPKEDKFLKTLAQHMEAPLADEGSPAQLVPLFVRGPAVYLKEMRQIELNLSGANYPEVALRSEAISRLANGLDMPREVLLGVADVNHWGSWQIDQQTWTAHIQPVVEELCDELTGAVLRPTLEDNGTPKNEARQYRVWYDAVKITNHPDRGKDAVDAYDRGELGGDALRLALGFNEDDVPTIAELARWVGVRVRDAGLAWYGVPTLKTTGAAPEAPPTGDETPGIQATPEGETQPDEGGTGNDTTTGPPEAARLLGAAEAALFACRRAAGNRIVSKAPRDRDIQSELRSHPRHLVYARIGGEKHRFNGAVSTPEDLVRGGAEALEHTLEAWGYPPERIGAITRLVERHAAQTLHEERPHALPPILLNL